MATRTNTFAPFGAAATSWWTQRAPKSLRARLTLWAAVLLCMIQVVLGTLFYSAVSSWFYEQVDRDLLSTAERISASIRNYEDLATRHLDFPFEERSANLEGIIDQEMFFARIIAPGSREVIRTSDPYDVAVSALAINGRSSFETLTLTDTHTHAMRVYSLPLPDPEGHILQVGRSLDEIEVTQGEILRLLVIMLIFTALLAAVTGWFLADRALVPVDAITRTAQAIGAQDLSRRISTNLPKDELGRLAQTFNKMLDRIENAFRQQKLFTADAAHELRTPLSIIRTGIDVTLGQERNPDEYRATLENVREEVERLSQLTTNLLMLSRADAQTLMLERQSTNLSDLLNVVADQVTVSSEQKQIAIQRDIPAGIHLQADEGRLIQLALNLLENAIKYTPSGGRITLSLRQLEHNTQFTVADTGPGIPPEDLPHVFERFYRVDRARTRSEGGFGLGLAIALQIAQLHGGDINVASNPGEGATFTVTLPTS